MARRQYAPDGLVKDAAARFACDPTGGVVVVTRFDCSSYRRLAVARVLHSVLGHRIRAEVNGLLFSVTFTKIREKRIISISAFGDIGDVYQMGCSKTHIKAAHLAPRLGLRTSAGVFPYAGDWRHILFGIPEQSASPLLEYRSSG
jgi:hypothetical protein